MALRIQLVLLSLCLVSTQAVDSQQSQSILVRKRPLGSLVESGAALAMPRDQLKEMLAKVLKNPEMQKMAKDPQMVEGLIALMHDPDKIAELTQDPDLAQSLHALVEKDP